ncbi:hypothetical protein CHCC20347_1983 [Bacillus paralicheniformis]|uniref:Uncharacterized protein n=1 Tax=Bacillus paralicheniformis TaxID=1648923 RepID=A0ABY3FW55_9BACI|nr:hypothetical protein CHCC20347_1983 [Bacillus paralicheniformis]TWL37741.1 hypothetical protein CHCC15381_2348 [Bacillus paralicheniformis]
MDHLSFQLFLPSKKQPFSSFSGCYYSILYKTFSCVLKKFAIAE